MNLDYLQTNDRKPRHFFMGFLLLRRACVFCSQGPHKRFDKIFKWEKATAYINPINSIQLAD